MAKSKTADPIIRTFAQNVLKYRKALSLTREELAEKCGLSPQNIARLESGERFVTSKSLERLSRAFNCMPSELFEIDRPITNSLGLEKIHKLLKNRSEKEILFCHQIISLIFKGP